MRPTALLHLLVVCALIAVPALLASSSARAQEAAADAPITVLASGLTNPAGSPGAWTARSPWRSPSSFSGVFKVKGNRTMTLVVDLSTWLPANKPAFIPPDFNPDGSLYALETAGDALPLTEAVGGQLIKVTPAGEISRVADLSGGHLVIATSAFGPDAGVGHGALVSVDPTAAPVSYASFTASATCT